MLFDSQLVLKQYFEIQWMNLGGTCFYDHLRKAVKYPGNAIGQTFRSLRLIECQEKCDSNERCNNFKHCGGDCTLYDGLISKNSEQDPSSSSSCITLYKTCPQGICINIFNFF